MTEQPRNLIVFPRSWRQIGVSRDGILYLHLLLSTLTMEALIPLTTSGSLVDCVDSKYYCASYKIAVQGVMAHPQHSHCLGAWRWFTTSEKMLVVLRDGRKLIGVLRSYDQFGEIGPRNDGVTFDCYHPHSLARPSAKICFWEICLRSFHLNSSKPRDGGYR
jgi:hypothetical protein